MKKARTQYTFDMQVMFTHLVTPRPSKFKPSYELIAKADKNSDTADSVIEAFEDFSKKCGHSKQDAETFFTNYVKDGATDDYWGVKAKEAGHDNSGFFIFSLKNREKPNVYMKDNSHFKSCSADNVSYGDTVKVVLDFVSDITKKGLAYCAVYLSDVLIIEKQEINTAKTEQSKTILEKTSGLKFKDDSNEIPF